MMDEIQVAAGIARLLADPLRLKMLQFLTWGPASVAELVAMTGSTQSNVSNHLKLLRQHEIVLGEKAGRQVIYRVGSAAIGELITALSWAAIGKASPQALPVSAELSEARTCYDHLAGRVGVRLLDRLCDSGALVRPNEAWDETVLGASADAVFGRLGVDLGQAKGSVSRRRLAFACPDWSEHGRSHLGGLLGAMICERCMSSGWLGRDQKTRAVTLTKAGAASLAWLLDSP